MKDGPEIFVKTSIYVLIAAPFFMVASILLMDYGFKHKARNKPGVISYVDAPGGEIYTMKIGDHLYLVRNNSKAPVHSPECQCRNRRDMLERPSISQLPRLED